MLHFLDFLRSMASRPALQLVLSQVAIEQNRSELERARMEAEDLRATALREQDYFNRDLLVIQSDLIMIHDDLEEDLNRATRARDDPTLQLSAATIAMNAIVDALELLRALVEENQREEPEE